MVHRFDCAQQPDVYLTTLAATGGGPQKESWREVRRFLEVTVDSRQADIALLMWINGLFHGFAVLLRIGVVC
jgi:hypothetical protein